MISIKKLQMNCMMLTMLLALAKSVHVPMDFWTITNEGKVWNDKNTNSMKKIKFTILQTENY